MSVFIGSLCSLHYDANNGDTGSSPQTCQVLPGCTDNIITPQYPLIFSPILIHIPLPNMFWAKIRSHAESGHKTIKSRQSGHGEIQFHFRVLLRGRRQSRLARIGISNAMPLTAYWQSKSDKSKGRCLPYLLCLILQLETANAEETCNPSCHKPLENDWSLHCPIDVIDYESQQIKMTITTQIARSDPLTRWSSIVTLGQWTDNGKLCLIAIKQDASQEGYQWAPSASKRHGNRHQHAS